MHLKKLELLGFKSFADRTELTFEPGITAIVGPNGCGKTNVVDAIKWVLGETAPTSLRGSQMADVIFNGAAERKPMGIAEVNLTVDNDSGAIGLPYSEVRVTRRIAQSGEGEYLINRQACRRRDIQEMFMDTGVGGGGHAAYSVIGQGRVDQVLSSKPEDRRAIFEEASGIMKYKARKREALSKLTATEENLLRLDDIIGEVRRQINSLKRQAAKARRYQRMREELADLEVRLALTRYRADAAEAEGLAQEIQGCTDEVVRCEAAVREGEALLQRLRTESIDLEKEHESIREADADIGRQIGQVEGSIALLKERVENLGRTKTEVEAEIATLFTRRGETEEQLSLLRERLTGLGEQADDGARRVRAAEEAERGLGERLSEAEAAASGHKSRLLELSSEQASARNRISDLRAEREGLRARAGRLEAERARVAEEAEALRTQIAEIDARISAQNAAVEDAKRIHSSAAGELEGAVSELESAREKVNHLHREHAARESSLAVLRDLRDRLEGYDEGAREVLTAGETLGGIRRSVAEVFDVPAEYELAMEAALGFGAQGIVADDTDAARAALSYLAEGNRGRALLIPLSDVRPADAPPQSPPQGHGVIGRAADLVRTPPEYDGVREALLGATVIVDTIDTALALRRGGERRSIVTMAGESVLPAGALVGGRVPREKAGLLRRHTVIEELSAEVDRLGAEVQAAEEAIRRLRGSVSEKTARVDQKLADVHSAERELVAMQSEGAQLSETAGRLREELTVLTNEGKTAQDAAARVAAELGEAEGVLADVSAKAAQAEEALDAATAAISALLSEREAGRARLTELRVELAGLAERRGAAEGELAQTEAVLGEIAARAEQYGKTIQRCEHDRAQSESGAAEAEANLKALFERRTELGERVREVSGRRAEAEAAAGEREKAVRAAREGLDAARERLHAAQVSAETVKGRLENLAGTIRRDYSLDLSEEAGRREPEDLDPEETAAHIEDMREKLERVGPVNLLAIEEHDELQERYDFLTAQQNDLLEAKDSLQKVIAEINRTTRVRFMETFERVAEAFETIFTELFPGGTGRLVLLDPDDPLECGIDIVCRPPGKRTQSVSLLSGGERALSAIALLFAILRVKPSPFCVLDEVDAALDEANIGRFADLLGQFSDKTQFLVVTHSKKTISAGNVLYGVTMEEPGVSKLISLRLAGKQEPPRVEEPAPLTETADDLEPEDAEEFAEETEEQPV